MRATSCLLALSMGCSALPDDATVKPPDDSRDDTDPAGTLLDSDDSDDAAALEPDDTAEADRPITRAQVGVGFGSGSGCVVGGVVTLDGTPLAMSPRTGESYHWRFVARPEGSAATLSGASVPSEAAHVSFVVDAPGVFAVELVVQDGVVPTPPDLTAIVCR